MKRWVLVASLVLQAIVASVAANACHLCLGGLRFAPGQQLDIAEEAVLAAPVADGTTWRVLQVVKGTAVAGCACGSSGGSACGARV